MRWPTGARSLPWQPSDATRPGVRLRDAPARQHRHRCDPSRRGASGRPRSIRGDALRHVGDRSRPSDRRLCVHRRCQRPRRPTPARRLGPVPRAPHDPCLHAGLLAQFTGHLSIAAALRPHAGIGQDQAHVTLSTAINAISISIHTEVRADRWMLYRHHSTFAGDGMTHSECRVHDEDGALIASFTVDAMVRAFADSSRAGDARSAL